MNPTPIAKLQYGLLKVEVYRDKAESGAAAARAAARAVQHFRQTADSTNLLFSTGASQFAFVGALGATGIDWRRIRGYHLDEYVGLPATHPASFRLWLQSRVNVPYKPASFDFINGDVPDVAAECERYAHVLHQNPIDLGFIGVGENGHIAFNDPPVADFNDPKLVKVVELDAACRKQQVGEGWFSTIADVPTHAVSLTVPAIMACRSIISVVPEERKAEAVQRALLGPVETSCPASILRTHSDATVFLDLGSASLLDIK